MTKNYTGPQTSKKHLVTLTVLQFIFKMLPKLRQISQYYATLATEHAINVIENGAKTVCSVQGFVSDVNNSNYSVVSTFAQATVVSLATFAYYNPPVLIGAFTLGAILISPSRFYRMCKKCSKSRTNCRIYSL
ncbi:MAG: hypothetical protein AB8U88_00685 [Rickettsia conorii subsp. raoultii]|uniref:Acyl-[acyl-carrier-protein]--UDP-N-acetylglucosamine O-acyltransferase n=1 Tax=Rickettsia conorii subsp. raoultii TaxID=369822 RepID=A0ABY4TZT8_RICCR|nr:hypothetical protein [Rickettsia conorii]URW77897.1 hypothetical protein NBT09_00525 [Rickettsia conorii subsp. raoultii]